MKKAFDQTVRDLKREVNKKVLKVPGIEQKVLDATSNEPWGPHGSNLADIAQATRNHHDYQLIMVVIWKRINDIGKNWRHVYKALTVLEYLVAHGSDRVIDEIREHAYQISVIFNSLMSFDNYLLFMTLSDFQYIDSSGKDQGSNVRKKSQSLVVLVNDKERIQEVRQKAIANRDKFRNTSPAGGMYRPNTYSNTGGYGDRYDDDRYEGRYANRDEDRNGYERERERERGYRDDDRYGRVGDSHSRDGDRYGYGRDSDERYDRDGFRDDDYRGRNRSNDNYQGSRSRSSDRDKDHAFEDDGRNSSRSSGARADEHSQDGRSRLNADLILQPITKVSFSLCRRIERKFSEQNIGAPPSYEEVVSDAQSPIQDERDGEIPAASAPKTSSQHGSSSPSQATTVLGISASPVNQEVHAFDEFDPRGSVSVTSSATHTASSAEMDLLGSLSESFSSNSLAIMPVNYATTPSEADAPINSGSETTFAALSASAVLSQPIDDPFGDSPFEATPSPDNVPVQPQNFASTLYFEPTMTQTSEPLQPVASSFSFGGTFPGMTYTTSNVPNLQMPSTSPQYLPLELSTANQNTDVLANILPPLGPSGPIASQAAFPAPTGPPAQPNSNVLASFLPQSRFAAPVASQVAFQAPTGQAAQPRSDVLGNLLPQAGPTALVASQPALTGSAAKAQPPKDKFETKSTVWADTLNRGLVNLNISGAKINPLADIGIDFDSINRMEKRKEKPASTPITSTVHMGKAMGSGSGIGRNGASVLRPPANPMGSGIGMGMGMGGGAGMGMGGYGGINQPTGMGMGMGMGMNMGMGMGMGQGVQMRPPSGYPPGTTIPGGYNPMIGRGSYPPQQPYGGYR
ncbi:hypothetical protein HHK36_013207 [Tetracentron sinense]|uniref:ENTH domain-containing protein n=1 Tax=Tetracentron sinense TaxID=13715 RepID=A0A834ZA92_TETSI|nr:hypothetical protein HHK36_013207 [Tetracentron sinense]